MSKREALAIISEEEYNDSIKAKGIFFLARELYGLRAMKGLERFLENETYFDHKLLEDSDAEKHHVDGESKIYIEAYGYGVSDGLYEGIAKIDSDYIFVKNLQYDPHKEETVIRNGRNQQKNVRRISFDQVDSSYDLERITSKFFQVQIAEINSLLNQIPAGVPRMLVSKDNKQEVYEYIISSLDGQKYIIGSNQIKVAKATDNIPLFAGMESTKQALSSILESLYIIKDQVTNSNLAQCCGLVRQIAIRPQIRPDFISIEEPEDLDEVYRFKVSDVNGADYVIIADEPAFIMRTQINSEGEEELVFIHPQEIANVTNSIRQKYIAIIDNPQFAELEPEILNKENELREDAISNLLERLHDLHVGACAHPADENGEYEIAIGGINGSVYSVSGDKILKSVASAEENIDATAITTSNKDRFMLHETIMQINNACEIIEHQSEAVLQCYERMRSLVESGDVPDFIHKQEEIEEGEEIDPSVIVMEINNSFYTINLDFEGRAGVYFVDEDGRADFLPPEQLRDFVNMINYELNI